VVPAEARLFERLSGEELLEYAGRLRGLPADEVRSRAAQLLEVLDLAQDGKRLVADYSTGMRKKAMLGCALIHNPSVLFLDEPLEGVDPISADVIRRLLTRFVASGSTVLFSSHVMELVEQVCAALVAGGVFFLLAVLCGGIAAADLTTVIFAVLGLAWLILPLVVFGLDSTLDPATLALYPLRTRPLAVGLLAASATGAWPLATLLGLLGVTIGLARGVLGVLIALLAVVLQVLFCITLARPAPSLARTSASPQRTAPGPPRWHRLCS
jgi:hypothetical protein